MNIDGVNNGIVPVMINSHLEVGLLDTLLETYKPSYIWLPADQMEDFAGTGGVGRCPRQRQ